MRYGVLLFAIIPLLSNAASYCILTTDIFSSLKRSLAVLALTAAPVSDELTGGTRVGAPPFVAVFLLGPLDTIAGVPVGALSFKGAFCVVFLLGTSDVAFGVLKKLNLSVFSAKRHGLQPPKDHSTIQ